MIKAGEVARLRITGEDVFVMHVSPDALCFEARGVAHVRRPVVGNKGVVHLEETFTLAELETPDAYRTRELAERIAMQQKVMQSGGAKAQAIPDDLLQMQ